MMSHRVDRRIQGLMPYTLLSFLLLLWVCAAYAQEDFSCHVGDGLIKRGGKNNPESAGGGKNKKNEGVKSQSKNNRPRKSAAIIPRGDINVHVENGSTEVLCRFNSSILNASNVYFATEKGPIDYHVYNDSTIRTFISHSEPEKYTLYCKMKRKNKDKKLCSQIVKAGFDPLDITNLSCIAPNNLVLNCSWEIPKNPVLTNYGYPTYLVRNFQKLKNCPEVNNDPPATFCYWGLKNRTLLRDEVVLHISANNTFGRKNFSHVINIKEYVHPDKLLAQVTLISALRAKVSWNLTYPIDVLSTGLWHSVEYRLPSAKKWENVTYFFHKHSVKVFNAKKSFSVEVNLPYANTVFEFRVRIHSGYEGKKAKIWSPYDILTIKTEPMVPVVAPKTSIGSFETVEVLDNRDIFVNFQEIDPLYYGGDDFHYNIAVYTPGNPQPIAVEPSETTKAFFRFRSMNYTEYSFTITAANEVGSSEVHSTVVVPKADCLPKKTDMFTVIITKSTSKEKTFSLYWVPSRKANEMCPGASSQNIDSYTIFWCKMSNGDRCKTKMYWREINDLDLIVKDLSDKTSADITIYEKNITDLNPDDIYTFGVAANSGQYSSGIRWGSCIVDETEPPLAPVTDVHCVTDVLSSVVVKWTLKCNQISAVPFGFNISYCKSDIPDFGHCTSEVEHIVVDSSSATNVTIHDLIPSYSYIFSVAVLSLIGEGRQSVPKMIKISDAIPIGPPTNVSIDSSTATSVELSWNPPLKKYQRGLITGYQISTKPSIGTIPISVPLKEFSNSTKVFLVQGKYLLRGLLPYTKYEINIQACTKVGCAFKFPAVINATTQTSVPSVVKDFEVDIANWRLSWTHDRCNSTRCSYDIKAIVNEIEIKNLSDVGGKILKLRDELGLECNNTKMVFKIREKGVDENGKEMYGNWTSVEKDADQCPSGFLPWWILFIIITFSFVVALVLLYIGRFGYGNIRKTIKDCYQNINLPKGIQAAETGKEIHRKEFPPEMINIRRISEPSLLLLHPDNSPVNTSFPRDERVLAMLNRASVSSEEVNLIDDVERDRHGRNLSGSSDHSSAQDSALMSGSPSVGDTDPDAMSSELGPNSQQETMLRLRNPGPAYVQQGAMLEKLSEGYVTAHSVPSLPHLYKEGSNANQQSTPNLNGSLQLAGWQNARRASTGYISMPDSELESPMKKDPVSIARTPVNRVPGLPSYSRHSFSPNLKPELIKQLGTPNNPMHVGYVTISDARSPSPPTSGYVSAGDPLKRPPSLPLIMGGEPLPLGAYCKVASRENSTASPGYVSAGPVDSRSTPVQTNASIPRNPYVTYGEAAMMSVNKPDSVVTNPPYVELSDAGRWAQPMNRISTLASAPVESNRIGRVGQMPRPNTTEATIGHRKTDSSPSLSKQSSGYVSQETIHPCDSVLMSPKRLLSQSAVPHTVLMSPSHQASMV